MLKRITRTKVYFNGNVTEKFVMLTIIKFYRVIILTTFLYWSEYKNILNNGKGRDMFP